MNQIDKVLPELFDKQWKKMINLIPKYGNMVINYDGVIKNIEDISFEIVPRNSLYVGPFKYVGPGDIIIYVDVNTTIWDMEVDYITMAQDVIIPWINKAFFKYFNIEIFNYFADITVLVRGNDGSQADYVIDGDETNIDKFDRENPPSSWKFIGWNDDENPYYKNRSMRESINESNKKIKGLYLTFPRQGWETFGATLAKLFGVVSGVFTNSSDAIEKINKVKQKVNEPLDEFVVGSHGGGQELFMSQDGEQPEAVTKILDEAKPLIDSNTKVFFTACYGADYLKRLTEASKQLGGVGVYGSAGIYNYITNKSEKGFYYCKTSADVSNELQNKKNSEYGKGSGPQPTKDEFNSFALEKGYCKKVDQAPINWVKNLG